MRQEHVVAISIAVAIASLSCGGSNGISGTRAGTDKGPPVANAGYPVTTSSGVPAMLDGRASYDPDGAELTYSWAVTAQPSGASPSLTNATSSTPTFSATTPGTYTVTLTVTAPDDEMATASVTVTVAVDLGPPVARVVSPVTTPPGTPVVLDASQSYDPNGTALAFSWAIIKEPSGASPALSNATTSRPTFSATAAGSYTVQVTVTAPDDETASATATVLVPPSQTITALTHRVAQAAYSTSLERVVMTDGSPSALYVYDPATGAETSVALALPPQCLGLSPDGLYAVVGHDAWISYVDLSAVKVVKTIPVTADIGDCVLAGNGWAYLFPRVDQWVALHSVEIANGTETNSSSWAIYAGDRARLSPSDPNALYFVTSELSPAQIYRWDVSGGAAVSKWESPYWGDYAMGPELWFSADGSRLFTAAGTAFRTSSVQSQDLVYGGQISGLASVKQLDCSTSEIAAIPAVQAGDPRTPTTDTVVELFGTTYLGYVDEIVLPWWSIGTSAVPTHGVYVFHSSDGTQRFVIVQADGSSGLLHDTAILTF